MPRLFLSTGDCLSAEEACRAFAQKLAQAAAICEGTEQREALVTSQREFERLAEVFSAAPTAPR
jgi:hypothetical protein